MVPFAVLGTLWYNHLSYDLVGNLPGHAASVTGTRMLQQHFAPGTMGPVTLLIRNDQVDFASPEGREELSAFADRLIEHQHELQLADLRSVTYPLGTKANDSEGAGSVAKKLGTKAAILRKARDTYVSRDETLGTHVTKIDLLMAQNPFSEQAIDFLGPLEARIRELLPEGLHTGSELSFSGSTASLRDLKSVGAQDRTLINVLVVGSVFVIILVALLRRLVLTVYLLLTVLFGYLVTLGITFGVFYLADPAGFQGLDWTVPLFLFTVLIAIGEDYNILLVTRIHEEQQHHGAEPGVAVALARTGPIISSCGFIMSGTFLSLWIGGQLARMTQLGFALACGVLLDTFVVRPILVPAYLILIGRRFGASKTKAAALAQASIPTDV
jgi:RND superfamily putative drug exporter